MMYLLFLSLCLSTVSVKESRAISLIDSLNDSSLSYNWLYYPLTTFPALKGQEWPWSHECEGKYLETGNPNHVFCKCDDNIFYVGTYVEDRKRAITLYRCEKFLDSGKGWIGLGEYVVVESFGEITGIFYKSRTQDNLKQIQVEELR